MTAFGEEAVLESDEMAGTMLAYRYIEALAKLNLLGETNEHGYVSFLVRRFANIYDQMYVVAMIDPTDPSYMFLDTHLWNADWDVEQVLGRDVVNDHIFKVMDDIKAITVYRDGDRVWARTCTFTGPNDAMPDVELLAGIIKRSLAALEVGVENLIGSLNEAAQNDAAQRTD